MLLSVLSRLPLLVLLTVGGLAAGGCASGTHATGLKIGWRTLARGLTSSLTEPRREVIRSEADYFKLWADHAAEARQVALPPTVDFTSEMVLVVALGHRPTGGYLVDIVDVELRGRTLRVLVGEREPRPGMLQIQQQTQPYVMVVLPAMAARVDFHRVREADLRRANRSARPGQEGDGDGGGGGGGRGMAPAREPVRVRPAAPVRPVESPRGATK